MKVFVPQLCLTLCDCMDCPWNSPGKNTGVGHHSILQRIFPTQGLNPGFLHCRQILYHLNHQGTPLFWYNIIIILGINIPTLCMHVCWVIKLCLTLCNPMDCSLPGLSVCEIFQARILEGVAISFSRGIFLTPGMYCLLWQVDSLPLVTWAAHFYPIGFCKEKMWQGKRLLGPGQWCRLSKDGPSFSRSASCRWLRDLRDLGLV